MTQNRLPLPPSDSPAGARPRGLSRRRLLTGTAALAAGAAGTVALSSCGTSAAPPGATGRVYGTVYSGLDLGFCLAAPVFGYMLDHGMSHGVFYGSAIALVLSVVSAVVVGDGVSRKSGMALSAG